MAILVGAKAAGIGAVSPAPNAGHASGQLEIVVCEDSGEGALSLSTAAGFAKTSDGTTTAEVGVNLPGAGASTAHGAAFHRVWNGSDGTPTIADPGNHAHAYMISIPVADFAFDSSDPIHSVWLDTSQGGSNGTSRSAPGGTSIPAGALVIAIVFGALPDSNTTTEFGSWANADLASVTELIDSTTDAGNGGSLGVASGVFTAGGTLDATTVTTTTSTRHATMTIVINPAPSGDTDADAGGAEGTGAAGAVSAKIAPNAGGASGTGAAGAASARVAPNAGGAAGTGAAGAASARVAPNAGGAAGTGAAGDATVSTGGASTNANAEGAAGTGAAGSATVNIAPNAGGAAGTGAAGQPSIALAPFAGGPTGTGAAGSATVNIAPNAGAPTATGVAGSPSALIAVHAGGASGTGAAGDATVAVSGATSASAGAASGTGQAGDPTVITVSAPVAPVVVQRLRPITRGRWVPIE